ncbi:MAG: sugar-binding protein [Planctomycetes bacterium]|nr:sugar-binding protein [Planctomycetota bacterium]
MVRIRRLGIVAVVLALAACERGQGRLRLGFVTNTSGDFWKMARAGIRDAEKELDVTVSVQEPGEATPTEQKRILESLIGSGVKGIALSALSPESQVDMIDEAAAEVPVVCMDSDAPRSKRVAYIGTDNVQAGRVCGMVLRGVLPEGGKIVGFVGKLDSTNARERIDGIREVLAGTGIEIVEILTDEAHRPTAQRNVEAAIAKVPDVGCLLGIWAYNGPAIAKVVRDAGRKIPIVCFDEEEGTLRAIEDGTIHATVVQDPYAFGYLSIKLLARLARGEKPPIPANGLIYTPIRIVMEEARDPLDVPGGEKIDVVGVAGFHENVRRLLAEGTR